MARWGKGRTGTPMTTVSRRKRRKRKDPYVRASAVKITKADGTVEWQPSLSPDELRRVVDETCPRGWTPQTNDPERRDGG